MRAHTSTCAHLHRILLKPQCHDSRTPLAGPRDIVSGIRVRDSCLKDGHQTKCLPIISTSQGAAASHLQPYSKFLDSSLVLTYTGATCWVWVFGGHYSGRQVDISGNPNCGCHYLCPVPTCEHGSQPSMTGRRVSLWR